MDELLEDTIARIDNAIKTVKNTSAKFIKEGLTKNWDVLFYKHGKQLEMGFDLHCFLIVNGTQAKNKKEVLEVLKEKKERYQNEK
jgi:MinD-like ATPase involved in chromosome partitioning or flagellar assembly